MGEPCTIDIEAVKMDASIMSIKVKLEPFTPELKEFQEAPIREYGSIGSHYVNTSSDYLSSDSKHYVKKRSGW